MYPVSVFRFIQRKEKKSYNMVSGRAVGPLFKKYYEKKKSGRGPPGKGEGGIDSLE